MDANDPDILCLQETKVTDQEFPEDEFGDLQFDGDLIFTPVLEWQTLVAVSFLDTLRVDLDPNDPLGDRAILRKYRRSIAIGTALFNGERL